MQPKACPGPPKGVTWICGVWGKCDGFSSLWVLCRNIHWDKSFHQNFPGQGHAPLTVPASSLSSLYWVHESPPFLNPRDGFKVNSEIRVPILRGKSSNTWHLLSGINLYFQRCHFPRIRMKTRYFSIFCWRGMEISCPQKNVNNQKQNNQGLQFLGILCINDHQRRGTCLTSIFQNPGAYL